MESEGANSRFQGQFQVRNAGSWGISSSDKQGNHREIQSRPARGAVKVEHSRWEKKLLAVVHHREVKLVEDCTTIWDNWATSNFRRVAFFEFLEDFGRRLGLLAAVEEAAGVTVVVCTAGAKANGAGKRQP